jgi:hypothetical protein
MTGRTRTPSRSSATFAKLWGLIASCSSVRHVSPFATGFTINTIPDECVLEHVNEKNTVEGSQAGVVEKVTLIPYLVYGPVQRLIVSLFVPGARTSVA